MEKNGYSDIMIDIYEVSPFMSANREKANKFYVTEAKKNGSKVLEFGTATGLLTIPLASEGLYVESVDMSQDMYNYTKQRISSESKQVGNNINLILSDMITYRNNDIEFDTVILADNVLLAANDFNKQILTLKNAYRHLRKGGKLILDIFTPDFAILSKEFDRQDEVFFVPSLNKNVFAHTYVKVNQLKQMLEIDFVHEVLDENNIIDKRHLSHVSFRYIFPTELLLMLNQCNFKVEDLYGDFNYNKKNNYKSLQVVIATK